MQSVNVGQGVTLFNQYVKKDDYNINYDHYIIETQRIIDEINQNYQLKLL